MSSDKRWCIEVSKKSLYDNWIQRHLFSTRKAAQIFMIKYGGRFRYNWSGIKRIK